MYFCYILQSQKSGRFYIGHTADIQFRLIEHNTGRVDATRNKGPWNLVWSEAFETRSIASQREREIKGWKSAVMMRKLISEQG